MLKNVTRGLFDCYGFSEALTGHSGLEEDAECSAVSVCAGDFPFHAFLPCVVEHFFADEFFGVFSCFYVGYFDDHLFVVLCFLPSAEARDDSLCFAHVV